MDLEHAAALAERPHRLEDRGVRSSRKSNTMNALPSRRRHRRRRQLGDRVVHPARGSPGSARSRRPRPTRRRPPLTTPAPRANVPRRTTPGSRVVERQERRRPAERSGHGVLEEAVRLGVGRDPRVGVHVDGARQDEEIGRVDDLPGRAASPTRSGSTAFDPIRANEHIRTAGAGRGNNRSAYDEQVGPADVSIGGHSRRVTASGSDVGPERRRATTGSRPTK